MSVATRENLENSSDLAVVERLLSRLPASARASSAVNEGKQIFNIVESLGMPADVLAAVRLQPLLRAGIVDEKMLLDNNLGDILNLVSELQALSDFRLPDNWSPGESLAVKQSEALRKMLLAVVSDVRLVLVRIAEQLYRLRRAKTLPRHDRQQLALETARSTLRSQTALACGS